MEISPVFYFTFECRGVQDSRQDGLYRYRSMIACHRAVKAHREKHAGLNYRIVNDKTGESLPCQFTDRKR
jgi:hypothetical protein